MPPTVFRRGSGFEATRPREFDIAFSALADAKAANSAAIAATATTRAAIAAAVAAVAAASSPAASYENLQQQRSLERALVGCISDQSRTAARLQAASESFNAVARSVT